jgi:hypothetical protein
LRSLIDLVDVVKLDQFLEREAPLHVELDEGPGWPDRVKLRDLHGSLDLSPGIRYTAHRSVLANPPE